ncbi:MAG: hypothetical protein KAS07_03275, partial [Candidatus Pacebacteria bacterium]|nr:hypothetical protein [Candidatus Paceibacterota bacterium]
MYDDIDPDEIFLDSSNLPEFDTYQFEGRIVKSLSKTTIYVLGSFFVGVVLVFLWKIGSLQVVRGSEYADISENNRLAHTYLFPERGVVFDINKNILAWNTLGADEFSLRAYTATSGLAHVLGYIKYPQADTSGIYYKTEYTGETGVEKMYNKTLNGKNGLKIIERNALLEIESESVIDPPEDGDDITLTIDARVQSQMYAFIKDLVYEKGFEGGAGVIMDIHTGGVLALTSYPEYSSAIMSDGQEIDIIEAYNNNEKKPYLNRVVSGRYTPGSIVKPIVAIAALNEGVITPEKKILSTGKLVVPNPWDPELSTVFNDWKAHGWTDMREAIAVSSDVYFYEVGGGFAPDKQEGIGIANIEKYARMFGMGEMTGIDLPGEIDGVIPNPEWKKENFDGEDWYVGNTYHTAIGQYGFQITPLQALRAIAAVASNGKLVVPHVLEDKNVVETQIDEIDPYYFRVVQEGMRQAVTAGTAAGLSVPYITIAAKTGTAEIGSSKSFVNSWIVGFFPYEDP